MVVKLRKKHRKTLQAIFVNPIRTNIKWDEVESLLLALKAELSEGRGSRLRVYLNDRRAVLHRPHPEKEIHRGMVKSIRRFLIEAGIDPRDYEE
jgi:predicted RNA binding protein YcfA (HicA-like mRNA interferase family)